MINRLGLHEAYTERGNTPLAVKLFPSFLFPHRSYIAILTKAHEQVCVNNTKMRLLPKRFTSSNLTWLESLI